MGESNARSSRYDDVKRYFDKGLWKEWALRDAVTYNWITAEEYEEIVGEAYGPAEAGK